MSSCAGVNIFGSSSPVRVFISRYVLVDPQQPQQSQPSAQPQQGLQNGTECPSTPGGGSSSGHHRPYYAYRVEASLGGGARFVRVERRYSQFLALHNELRKSVRTPEFPPKRLRNTSHKLLEERRAGLELYLQRLVRLNPVPGALLEFLGLSGGGEALHEAEVGRLAAVCPDRPTHQPVAGFAGKDPFLAPEDDDNRLPDIVAQATLDFFYKQGPLTAADFVP